MRNTALFLCPWINRLKISRSFPKFSEFQVPPLLNLSNFSEPQIPFLSLCLKFFKFKLSLFPSLEFSKCQLSILCLSSLLQNHNSPSLSSNFSNSQAPLHFLFFLFLSHSPPFIYINKIFSQNRSPSSQGLSIDTNSRLPATKFGENNLKLHKVGRYALRATQRWSTFQFPKSWAQIKKQTCASEHEWSTNMIVKISI